MKLWHKNLILMTAVVLIAAVPLITLKNSEFGGTDDAAGKVITEIDPDYVPWFESLIELPGGEMETLLFSLQAAIGAGVVGFVLGRITAKPSIKKGKDHGDGCVAN